MLVSVTTYNAGSIRVPCTHNHWRTRNERNERKENYEFSWQDDYRGVTWPSLYLVTSGTLLSKLSSLSQPLLPAPRLFVSFTWEQGNKVLLISYQFWIKTVNLPVLFQDFFKFCCGCIPYEYASIMRATYYILTIWTEECKRLKHMKFLKLTFTFNTVVKYRIIQRKQISVPEWCSSVIRCDLETIRT